MLVLKTSNFQAAKDKNHLIFFRVPISLLFSAYFLVFLNTMDEFETARPDPNLQNLLVSNPQPHLPHSKTRPYKVDNLIYPCNSLYFSLLSGIRCNEMSSSHNMYLLVLFEPTRC